MLTIRNNVKTGLKIMKKEMQLDVKTYRGGVTWILNTA
jgi:hypothetical protein